MEILFSSLAQYSGQILLVLCVFIAFLSISYLRRARAQDRLFAGLKQLLATSSGEGLEDMLHRHLHERAETKKELEALKQRLDYLEQELALSKRHLGLVRYDAFEEVGGNQSFALALYDDNGNGAIVNGVVGRTDARVYCKQLVNGRSERNLSQEEQRAIREAIDRSPRTMLSA